MILGSEPFRAHVVRVKSPRSIEQLVEDQARRWTERRTDTAYAGPHPAVAISRLPGARGELVAARLASELGYDLFDREIIHEIAGRAHLSDRLVATLDERNRSALTEWLAGIMGQQQLSAGGYLYHLNRLIGAMGRHGRVVIVGRGAHLILSPGEALRVLVLAPLEARVAEVAARDAVSAREAARRLTAEESERRAFLQQYFRADLGDPCRFDVVVNTHLLGVEGAVRAIRGALEALQGARHERVPVAARR